MIVKRKILVRGGLEAFKRFTINELLWLVEYHKPGIKLECENCSCSSEKNYCNYETMMCMYINNKFKIAKYIPSGCLLKDLQ